MWSRGSVIKFSVIDHIHSKVGCLDIPTPPGSFERYRLSQSFQRFGKHFPLLKTLRLLNCLYLFVSSGFAPIQQAVVKQSMIWTRDRGPCLCDVAACQGGTFLIHIWPVALTSLLIMHLCLLSSGVCHACFLYSLSFLIQVLKVELHLQLLQKYWLYSSCCIIHPCSLFYVQ